MAIASRRMAIHGSDPALAGRLNGRESPIVPQSSIAGRALIAVVAIMTFLAALTTGAVMLVLASASEWQSEVAREMTIQVRPAPGRDIEADVRKAADIARAAPGVAEVRAYSREESARLIEPWLGATLALDDLPVPRLIVVRVGGAQPPDLAALRAALGAVGATLDDHRGWIARMRAMAATAVAIGIGVLALVLAATILSVTFATRGAMAADLPIIEVLHVIGAEDRYIANEFQRHFLVLGLKGGVIGGGGALVLFALAALLGDPATASAGGVEIAALFGSLSIGPVGYALITAQIALNAAVTAATSRGVVNRTLASVT